LVLGTNKDDGIHNSYNEAALSYLNITIPVFNPRVLGKEAIDVLLAESSVASWTDAIYLEYSPITPPSHRIDMRI
jgi:hypothetical protein